MKNLTNEDVRFLNRAEKVTSFNLTPQDFQSLDYKTAIQYLFVRHFFPSFDTSKLSDGVDMKTLNNHIDKLRSINKARLQLVHKYPMKGFGPGEILLYFLVNDGHLGGGSSAGVDMITKSDFKKYEIKACNKSKDGFAYNFKLGGTFNTADLISEALRLKAKVKAVGEGVNSSAVKLIKETVPDEWKALEEKYRKRAYDNYFRSHEAIFMYNTTSKMGSIFAIKQVRREEIFIDVITSGIIKPRIRL